MINSRRNFLKGLFVAPAIVAFSNIMPVKAFELLVPPKLTNTEQLIADIQERLRAASTYSLFEPNDQFTRNKIKEMVTPYLAELKSRRGIYDYRVICDEMNNTPKLINDNALKITVAVKTRMSPDNIEITSLVSPTEMSFRTWGIST
jgi:hypothetical protein